MSDSSRPFDDQRLWMLTLLVLDHHELPDKGLLCSFEPDSGLNYGLDDPEKSLILLECHNSSGHLYQFQHCRLIARCQSGEQAIPKQPHLGHANSCSDDSRFLTETNPTSPSSLACHSDSVHSASFAKPTCVNYLGYLVSLASPCYQHPLRLPQSLFHFRLYPHLRPSWPSLMEILLSLPVGIAMDTSRCHCHRSSSELVFLFHSGA